MPPLSMILAVRPEWRHLCITSRTGCMNLRGVAVKYIKQEERGLMQDRTSWT